MVPQLLSKVKDVVSMNIAFSDVKVALSTQQSKPDDFQMNLVMITFRKGIMKSFKSQQIQFVKICCLLCDTASGVWFLLPGQQTSNHVQWDD